jgi:hypothetical protein
MKDIQNDVTDVQVRESFPDLWSSVLKSKDESANIDQAAEVFKNWDSRFILNSAPAGVFLNWERIINNHFHESKIGSDDFRRSLSNHPAYMSAFFKKVHDWANDDSTQNPMCGLNEFGGSNSCQDFMKYTLDKTMKHMQDNYKGFN